jgi:glucuronoarabinoxylan endo-1,4-beta-xylanase
LAAQDSNLQKDAIKLYPNPAKTEIFVELKTQAAMATIYDAKGGLVKSGLKMTAGKNVSESTNFLQEHTLLKFHHQTKKNHHRNLLNNNLYIS